MHPTDPGSLLSPALGDKFDLEEPVEERPLEARTEDRAPRVRRQGPAERRGSRGVACGPRDGLGFADVWGCAGEAPLGGWRAGGEVALAPRGARAGLKRGSRAVESSRGAACGLRSGVWPA